MFEQQFLQQVHKRRFKGKRPTKHLSFSLSHTHTHTHFPLSLLTHSHILSLTHIILLSSSIFFLFLSLSLHNSLLFFFSFSQTLTLSLSLTHSLCYSNALEKMVDKNLKMIISANGYNGIWNRPITSSKDECMREITCLYFNF